MMTDQQGHELDQLAHRSVTRSAEASDLLRAGHHQQAGNTALVAMADAVAMFAVMLADEAAERRAENSEQKVCYRCRDHGSCAVCGEDL